MLRLTFCFLVVVFLFTVPFLFVQSSAELTRLTNTPEHAINLNPTLSDNGQVVIFESSADLSGAVENSSFHTFAADLSVDGFRNLGNTRAVSPAVSSDGKIIVFASSEDLTATNPDRNSEIF